MRRRGAESTSSFRKETEEDQAVGRVGLLGRSLYVTRDAAQNWKCELGGFLEEIGLRRGQASTCLYSEEAQGESALQSMVMKSLSRPRGKTPSG